MAPLVAVLDGCSRSMLWCGQERLFKGFLTLAPACEVCGLDYAFADPADGPAFFVICFTCVPAVLFAVWLEVEYEVPYWVHLLTSLPLLLLTCIPSLRPLKGWLIASQYVYKAEDVLGMKALPDVARRKKRSHHE